MTPYCLMIGDEWICSCFLHRSTGNAFAKISVGVLRHLNIIGILLYSNVLANKALNCDDNAMTHSV